MSLATITHWLLQIQTVSYQPGREAGAYIIGTGCPADRQTVLDFGAQEFVDLDNESVLDTSRRLGLL